MGGPRSLRRIFVLTLTIVVLSSATAPALSDGMLGTGRTPGAEPGTRVLASPEWLALADETASRIQSRHLLPDTVVDPVLDRAGGREVTGYTHSGDSAIWTGHYLAAEAYRFAVTGDGEALANAARVLEGIHRLVTIAENWTVTGADGVLHHGNAGLLMRHCVPEARAGAFGGPGDRVRIPWNGEPWLCEASPSRDQYMGVVFGLGVAWNVLPDGPLRDRAGEDVTTLARFLVEHGWMMVQPDATISETFLNAPQHRLAILALAARVDPATFRTLYAAEAAADAAATWIPQYVQSFAVGTTYYKFNLEHIALFTLLSNVAPDDAFRTHYLTAFDVLRRTTADHGNAHFDTIAFAITGDETAAASAVAALAAWRERPVPGPHRDDTHLCESGAITCVPESYGEMTTRTVGGLNVKARWLTSPCMDTPPRALHPRPIVDRPHTDFLWQRSPFDLTRQQEPRVESPGIDYLLPYWMLRTHLEVTPPAPVDAPAFPGPVPHPDGRADVETPVVCESDPWSLFAPPRPHAAADARGPDDGRPG